MTTHVPHKLTSCWTLLAVAAAVCGSHAAVIVTPDVAHAASGVTVTRVDDPVPDECTPTDCSLREAVIFANANPDTTIHLPAGEYKLEIGGTGDDRGDLNIRTETTIIGAGVGADAAHTTTINAQRIDRIFNVGQPTGSPFGVKITGVRLYNGYADGSNGGGGAMWIGRNGHVTLQDSVVDTNESRASGGAVVLAYASSMLVTERVTFHLGFSNGVDGDGSTSYGGAIYATNGSALILSSTFDGNIARGGRSDVDSVGGRALGGAIYVQGNVGLDVYSSTFVGNQALGGDGQNTGSATAMTGGIAIGGAIYADSTTASVIVTSTFVGNAAKGGFGTGFGGAYAGGGAIGTSNAGSTTINGATVIGNTAVVGAHSVGTTVPGAGGIGSDAGTLTNSIVATNTAGGQPGDVAAITSNGYNLIGAPHNSQFIAHPTDLYGSRSAPLDPGVLEIADNGGPAKTVALKRDSLALGAGGTAACSNVGNVDQRGQHRPAPVGTTCDIGAFEDEGVPPSLTLTSSANPSDVGQAVTFTATVSSAWGTPTGTVTFRDGATSLGGGTIAGGVVLATTAALSAGTHAITASYEGDTVFATSSASLSQQVGPVQSGPGDPADPGGPGGPGGGSTGLQFFPLTHPVRLLDTRAGFAAHVAPGAPLSANQTLTLPGRMTIDDVTIPAVAQALVGNATVDNSSGIAAAGFATLWPSGSDLPLASNLNFVPGTTRPNSFTVGLGADGNFNLLSNTGGNFIIDITGYYAPPASGGLYFHPLSQPVRLLDTRPDATAVNTPDTPFNAGQTLPLQGRFTSNGVTVPDTALALAGNATVDNTIGAPAGFATLYPGGATLPPTSNLNYMPGTIAPNAFTVGLGADGTFNLYANSGGNYIIDITGYYDTVPTNGLLFHPLTQPVRELDTRPGANAVVHPNAPLNPDGTLTLPGAFDTNGITVPASAKALVGNATVDNTINAPAGYATLSPSGVARPLASNLNYTPGLVAPNAFTVGIGTTGTYDLYSQSGSNFIIDISGYFS